MVEMNLNTFHAFSFIDHNFLTFLNSFLRQKKKEDSSLLPALSCSKCYLILIIVLLLFPSPFVPNLPSHLTYSLLFHFHVWNSFFIVDYNLVIFPLEDPLDQGIVPVGETIK